MSEITFNVHLSFPEPTLQDIIRLGKERPFKKFISFPTDIKIAKQIFREEITMEIVDAIAE